MFAGSFSRFFSCLVACSMAIGATPGFALESIELPIADAQLEGCKLLQPTPENPDPTRLGNFKYKRDRARWTFTSPGGIYRLVIQSRSPFGPKEFSGTVGTLPFSGFFPQSEAFGPFDAGLVELPQGESQLDIGGGWGHYEIIGVTLRAEKVPAPPAPVPPVLVNPKATPEARALMSLLAANYGKKFMTGQHEEPDIKTIVTAADRLPAIYSSDLMFHSPSMVERQGPRPKHIDGLLRKAKEGHVISLCWHWNAPTGLLDTPQQRWWTGFYSKGTTFDFAPALDTAHPEHALLLRDIDAIAEQLKKLDAAKVPVLWRPLHECEGGWFWWGTKGPDSFKSLWRLLFTRLTHHHQLHNLIWVHTSEDPAWYPGDDMVDVVCIDAYPQSSSDPLVSRWEQMRKRFEGRKILALGEFPGVPDVPLMRRLGVHWAWFCSWRGSFGPGRRSTPELIRRVYQSEEAITLNEIKSSLQQEKN